MKEKIRNWLIRFSVGRYGHDQLNLTMLVTAIVLYLIGLLTGSRLCALVALVFLILVNVRALSRNTAKRAAENRKFLEITKVPRRYIKAFRLGLKDKEHRYVLCPSCHQICRVPKGRGKIEVHCPGCGTSFARKS